MHRGWLLAEPRLAYFSALVSTCDARPKRAQHVFHHILACSRLWSDPAFYMHPPQCSCVFCITIPSLCPPAPLLAPPPQTQSNLHMRVPRRCSTPWRRSALPPTSSLARTLYWPHCLRHTLNVSNAYPLPAPSPTSSLACTFVSHFIILLPAPSTSTQSTLPQPRPCRVLPPLTSTWGFHVADAAHRGITMPSVCPTPFNISNAYPIPAPSSHWGFHVADAARRGVTMCSALPPTSSLACTLYWRHVTLPAPSSHWGCHIADAARLAYFISCLHHVPLPPQVNLSTPSTLPWPRPCVLPPLTSTWGFHVCSTPWNHHALCLPHTL